MSFGVDFGSCLVPFWHQIACVFTIVCLMTFRMLFCPAWTKLAPKIIWWSSPFWHKNQSYSARNVWKNQFAQFVNLLASFWLFWVSFHLFWFRKSFLAAPQSERHLQNDRKHPRRNNSISPATCETLAAGTSTNILAWTCQLSSQIGCGLD